MSGTNSGKDPWSDLEVEGPDLGPPVVPELPAPPRRRWRFELPEQRLALRGRCIRCRGEHVIDGPTLERLIRGLHESGWTTPPCTCDCCSVLTPGRSGFS